jgi:hypothetical protein
VNEKPPAHWGAVAKKKNALIITAVQITINGQLRQF